MAVRHLVILAALGAIVSPARSDDAQTASAETHLLASGAQWTAEVPAKWNGTLLLWSRGYSPTAGAPEIAPPQVRDTLLAEGYALAGSNYGAGGWALEQAVPAQRDTVAAFAATYGKPRRVIAWGYSMGGLVSTALAEQRPASVDGAVAMCASIGGAVGMMNMALDGAYAFRTLIAPQSGIRLVGVDDDRANGKLVGDALAAAMQNPAGRARVALAGVLAGIPGWTRGDQPEPAPGDADAQADQIARSFAMGAFLPRADQEKRAGGVFSWNGRVDYRRQLARSTRRAFVEALYRKAGLDLDADLARLGAGPRIEADPKAVDYMMRNYTPNARPTVPIVAVQAIGDGLTSPSLQRGYAEAAGVRDVRSLYVRAAGHCGFAPQTTLAAIRLLDRRLQRGHWEKAHAPFIPHTPPPMLRPCVRGRVCE